MSDNTRIEMPYDNGKSLALEFIEKYSEAQLDVEIDEEQESEEDVD